MSTKANKDTYILTGVGAKLNEILAQKEHGYNPGVEVLVKDAQTLEVSKTKINIDHIEEILARPGAYQFTGVISKGFRISDYYYAEESPVEGYVSRDDHDICPIQISRVLRQARSYISPNEKDNDLKVKNERELYLQWKQQAHNVVP